MDTLERQAPTTGRAVNVTGGQGMTPDPEVMTLPIGEPGRAQTHQRNIIVALTDTEIDREAIAIACKAARNRGGEVYAAYGIVVPRKLALDDEMAAETISANHALDQAKQVADQMKAPLDTEIIHTRHFGQSLIQEASDHECALIVLGVSYRPGVNGQPTLGETAEYVLQNAPCRVWLVRGPCPQIARRGFGASTPTGELTRA